MELLPERAAEEKFTIKELWPMDKDENYLYICYHFDYFNKSGENYLDAR